MVEQSVDLPERSASSSASHQPWWKSIRRRWMFNAVHQLHQADEPNVAGGGVHHSPKSGPIAVLDIGGMHRDPNHQAERIDHDVAFAPGDLLARVVALRVDRRPPFCAARALWLSMIAAEGLASRPASSRQAT